MVGLLLPYALHGGKFLTKDGLSFLKATTFRKRATTRANILGGHLREVPLVYRVIFADLERCPRASIIRCKHEQILQLIEFKLARKFARCLSQYIIFARCICRQFSKREARGKLWAWNISFRLCPRVILSCPFVNAKGTLKWRHNYRYAVMRFFFTTDLEQFQRNCWIEGDI